jgi:hypothetical protein
MLMKIGFHKLKLQLKLLYFSFGDLAITTFTFVLAYSFNPISQVLI